MQLNSITLQSPGTLGLNTQDSDDVQDPRFCTQADNCVIAKNGLLESRKGFGKVNGSAATGTPTLDVVYSLIKDDGTEVIVSAGGNKLWSGTTALADETGALTVTDDNWQFQNYAGEVFGYNGTDDPVYWDGAAAAFGLIVSKFTDWAAATAYALGDIVVPTTDDGNYYVCTTAGTSDAAEPTWNTTVNNTTSDNTVTWTTYGLQSPFHLSAYGRSWVLDVTSKSTINYSDLLVPYDFYSGSAGSIDLNIVWPYSNDTITALAAHNNNLIIFCEKSIIVYGNANNINNIYLVEVIKDIGCIARDSIQNIGDDILFLSKDGVRSLSRTVIQDNMPQREISANVRDEMILSIAAETPGLIRSTYNEKEGFYILNFQSVPVQWVCDVRKAQEGIFRWTKWNAGVFGITTGSDNTLYGGLAGGWLSKYESYYDTDTSDGSEDQTYIMKYRSGWIDPGADEMKLTWKNMRWYTALGTTFTMTMTWAFDFLTNEKSYSSSATVVSGSTYGTGVYGTTVYGGLTSRELIKVPMSGVGSIVRIGYQTTINGAVAAFNKVAMFFKPGHKR